MGKIEESLGSLQSQIGTINIVLDKHNSELQEHTRLINDNSKALNKLEQIVEAVKVRPPASETMLTARLPAMTNPPAPTKPPIEAQGQKFDISRFSEQEKRILAVFFHNKDMALSYVDIAKALAKSPHTVKNQLNRMQLKANLFDKSVDSDSRNRFKFKDSLRIEKYLNVS